MGPYYERDRIGSSLERECGSRWRSSVATESTRRQLLLPVNACHTRELRKACGMRGCVMKVIAQRTQCSSGFGTGPTRRESSRCRCAGEHLFSLAPAKPRFAVASKPSRAHCPLAKKFTRRGGSSSAAPGDAHTGSHRGYSSSSPEFLSRISERRP